MPQPPLSSAIELDLRENEPLAPRTTLQVGGSARYYCEVTDDTNLRAAFDWARAQGLPTFVLGGGSNLLVSDSGFDGLVLRTTAAQWDVRAEGDVRWVSASAGAVLDTVIEECAAQGFAGLECLSGIPGSSGAAPVQNIGAYGQQLSDVLHAVSVLDTTTGATSEIAATECGFGYRTSRFKREWSARYVITGIRLRLLANGAPTIRYPELRAALGARVGGASPSASEVRAAVMDLRRKKSMVWDPADPNHRSAGSFFMNPVVTHAELALVRQRLGQQLGDADATAMPVYEAGPGHTKLPAAWLIEHAGFHKGYDHGPVGLSTRHALAIVNHGNARARDVLDLARAIRQTVRARFGVTLEPEPVLLGFADSTESASVETLLG